MVAAGLVALDRVLIGLGEDVEGTGDTGIGDVNGSVGPEPAAGAASVLGGAPADPPGAQPAMAASTANAPHRSGSPYLLCLENATPPSLGALNRSTGGRGDHNSAAWSTKRR
jgi:hypothetical protein